MEINIEELKQWITALRSGTYQQTKYALQDYKGYCCLGVACKVLIPENELLIANGFLRGVTPSYQDNAPQWLKDINVEFNKITGKALSELNDFDDYTFEQIADLLEIIYIKKESIKLPDWKQHI